MVLGYIKKAVLYVICRLQWEHSTQYYIMCDIQRFVVRTECWGRIVVLIKDRTKKAAAANRGVLHRTQLKGSRIPFFALFSFCGWDLYS